jgi:hypothetical protein
MQKIEKEILFLKQHAKNSIETSFMRRRAKEKQEKGNK